MLNERISEQKFNLGTILTITTGYRLSESRDIIRILNFLNNTNVTEAKFSQAMNYSRFAILNQHPELLTIDVEELMTSVRAGRKMIWLNNQKKKFGEELIITRGCTKMPEVEENQKQLIYNIK